MSSEAEAIWYLSTAGLTAPLGHDCCNIFFYLTVNYTRSLKQEIPDFLHCQPLNDMQRSDLKRLREWLFKRSMDEVKRML